MSAAINLNELLEWLATAASLLYIVFLIREKIACWLFGILSSVLSIYVFIEVQLYSQALLFLFYALMGVWGWLRWHRRDNEHCNPVLHWRLGVHLRNCVIACLLALGLGYAMAQFTAAERPVFDAFTTIFSFLGTYLEISKVLEAWIFWLFINLASVWLYHDRDLDIYAGLIGIYSVMSIWGFVQWRKTYLAQSASVNRFGP
jgi:nicotinamide mononucleotide transporter